MKIKISLSRLPGERTGLSLTDRLGARFKRRDELSKEQEDWWASLTDAQKDAYLQAHPNSKHTK